MEDESITNINMDPSILENQNEAKGVKSEEAWPTFREFVEDVMAPIIIMPTGTTPLKDFPTVDELPLVEQITTEKETTGRDNNDPEYIKSITSKTVNVNPYNLEIEAPITLSTEELDRRQEEANAQYAPVQAYHGDVVQVGSMPDTDYIVMTFSDGTFSQPLHRRTAIERAGAILEMIEQETGSATSSIVDKDVWLCLETLRAAIKNGRSRGLDYNTQAIKNFEKRILKAEKSWRDRSDYKPGPDAPRKVYMGNN